MNTDPFANLAIEQNQKLALRKQLESLARHSTDTRIQQLARDVLAGKQDLRAAMLGPRYEDTLNAGVTKFSAWYNNLTDEQRAEQDRQANEYFAQLRKEANAAPRRRRPPTDDDDWEAPTTIYRRPDRR